MLSATPPRLTIDDAIAVAATLYGVTASGGREMSSERDQAFLMEDGDARPLIVLKVSNPSESPEVLDMEAAAVQHITRVDPGLRVALPWRTMAAGDPGPARPVDPIESLRGEWHDGPITHWVRGYEVMPGTSRVDPRSLSDAALIAWGETTARLSLALRGFMHPRAQRTMPWDVQHALTARGMLADISDPEERALVARVLDRYEQVVSPSWPRLRAQVVHGDLTVDNTLTDEQGLVSGVIDFGDMSHTALITDLASAIESLTNHRDGDDLFRSARLILDGFQARTELEDLELGLIGDLWAARCALTISISSWRVARGLEEAEYAQRSNDSCRRTLELMESIGWTAVARALGADVRESSPAALVARRAAVFGRATEPLHFDAPLEVASASGVWITDVEGRRYLDAYNNVPCVGHGHPRVTGAIARQSRRINTHMRYLHPTAIELSERLVRSCPPGLDTVMLVNSGSEANDLAWSMAAAATGRRGGICTARAYHGVTEASMAFSPESWLDGWKPAHVETWQPPDSFRGAHLPPDGLSDAFNRLRSRFGEPAAVILDPLLTSERITDLDPAYAQELVRRTREAGALWIADEVQAGHGRTGSAMWAFQRLGIVPDFVTLGKPMGNGHPVAAVITRRDIVDALAGHSVLFSTFGGNPVSAAAALAVLEVIEDERVLDRVTETGAVLGAALRALAAHHSEIGDVRGVGLAWGVELVTEPGSTDPDAERARAIRNRLRHLGVLIGTTGEFGNLLKIRPPLAFTTAHVPIFIDALATALDDTARTD